MAEERRPRPEHHAPTAAAALDARSQAFQEVLKEVLSSFQCTHGAMVNVPQVQVEPGDIVPVCRTAKEDPRLGFKVLLCLAAVDYKEHFQMVYLLHSMQLEQVLCIKTDVPYGRPHLPSVMPIWRAANWYEREAHDLFGIVFDGHPNLAPLLLYEGFEGYPGRKEYPFYDYQEF